MGKKQHVVPRAYLKNFQNENGKVYAYNLKNNKAFLTNVNEVCFHNYSYEAAKKDHNNKLESILSKYESDYMPHINMIVEKFNQGILKKEDINHEICYKFMILQYLRSDSNRIMYTGAVFGLEDMIIHPSINTLENLDFGRVYFNARFENKNELKKFLNMAYGHEQPIIHVISTKDLHLITSDNPVIAYYYPTRLNCETMVIMLPISPNICLYFYGMDSNKKYQKQSDVFPEQLHDSDVYKINQGIIYVANYWIISKNDFNIIEFNLINKSLAYKANRDVNNKNQY